MAGDDLKAPLGLNKSKRGIFRLPLGLMGSALLTLILTTGLIWIGIVDDPYGGEPTASVKLDNTIEGISQRDIGVADLSNRGNSSSNGPKTNAGPRYEKALTSSIQADGPLSSKPDELLLERSKHGLLPQISTEGLRPLDSYARRVPSDTGQQPRVAVVVSGVGLNSAMSALAINELPADFTLALSPYGDDPANWMQKARTRGHELLMQMPMEPYDYPDNDAGPHSLLVRLSEEQNWRRTAWVLSRTTNYVGLVNSMGARFTADEQQISNFLKTIRNRGLMFVDDSSSPRSKAEAAAVTTKTPFSKADVVIDKDLNEDAIGAQLLQLESLARSRGVAVGSATAFPVTLTVLKRWAEGLEDRGIVLIPISATIPSDRSPASF